MATTERDSPLQMPGTVSGAPFSARLVQAYGTDIGEAHRTVILEMEDGCRRQYRAASFVAADLAVIDAAIAAHPMPADTATYTRHFRDGVTSQAELDRGVLRSHVTQHFAVWYGTDTTADTYRDLARDRRTIDGLLAETGDWLEQQWLLNRDVVGAPMPYAGATDRRKLDIFICGTGLPNRGGDLHECGASAAETMNISYWGLNRGSLTLVHEFGHMIQFYSGGFRDKTEAGVIWETGAEWNAFAVSPTFPGFMNQYFNQLENGPLFSHARYGAHPFMTYLFEKDDTRPLLWRTWQENRRGAAGETLEDWVPAFVRLAQAAGIYPQGFRSFADDMGWYGARLAAMDFLNQRALLDAFRTTRVETSLAHFYTPLAADPAAADSATFVPPAERPLLEWGTHLVPLTATAGTVSVTLTGATQANAAAWRFTIVAVTGGTTPHYAPLGKVDGTGSATTSLVVPANARLYLAVTATPYEYQTLGWQADQGPLTGTTFPYRVRIVGATPRTGPASSCDPTTEFGGWTTNYRLSNNSSAGRPCT